MLRVLRAFAWLRWRSLVNTLEHSGGRDALGRLSTAIDSLVPLIVVLLMLPTVAAFAGVAGYAGWSLAHGRTGAFDALRIVAAAGLFLVVLAPILFPSRERPNAVRLLLLPISRRTLYLAHALALLLHPLLLLAAAAAAGVTIGLALGGHLWGAAVAAAAAGMLLLFLNGALVGITCAAQLVVQDRRRGEWVALGLFLLLPAVGLLPSLSQRGSDPHPGETAGRGQPAVTVDRRVMRLLPSEAYLAATRAAVQGTPAGVAVPLLSLAVAAGLAHGAAGGLFARVLVHGSASRRSAAGRRPTAWRVPIVPAAAAAVAVNHVRLVFRTPRGRFSLLSPLVLLLLVVVFARNGTDAHIASIPLASSLHVAAFTALVALLGTVPLAMNQFAIDGPGLTLLLFSPLETRAWLAGKALGIAVAAALPAGAGAAVALATFPPGDPYLWLCLPLAFVSVVLLCAPIAAAVSVALPRKVDLRHISRGSNAHGAASLIGTVAIVTAAALSWLPAFLAVSVLGTPALAPLFLLLLSLGCAAICTAVLGPIQRLLDRRRENLAMLR